MDRGFKVSKIYCLLFFFSILVMYTTSYKIEEHNKFRHEHNKLRHEQCMFQCHRASGQVWAEVARNLADSLIIPFKIQDYANKLREGVEELDRNLGSLMRRKGIQTGNKPRFEIKPHSERPILL